MRALPSPLKLVLYEPSHNSRLFEYLGPYASHIQDLAVVDYRPEQVVFPSLSLSGLQRLAFDIGGPCTDYSSQIYDMVSSPIYKPLSLFIKVPIQCLDQMLRHSIFTRPIEVEIHLGRICLIHCPQICDGLRSFR